VGKGVRVSLNMRRDVVGGGQPRKSSPSYASHIAYEMSSLPIKFFKLLFRNHSWTEATPRTPCGPAGFVVRGARTHHAALVRWLC
jgi:hypothetical protein